MIEQNDCQEDCGCKKSYSSGDFKQQGTSAYNCNDALLFLGESISVMATVQIQVLLSPLEIIVHHIVYSSP